MKNEKWIRNIKTAGKKKKRNENNVFLLSKKIWKLLLNFLNDHRKSTMNSLNLTPPSLPSEKLEKRQWETHFGAKYVFASHLPLPVEVAYKKAYR